MHQLSLALTPPNSLLIEQIKVWQSQLASQYTPGAPLAKTLLAVLEKSLQQELANELIYRIQQGYIHQKSHHAKGLSAPIAQQVLQQVRQERQLARDKNSYPGKRKLDNYHQEIIQLINQGASQRDVRWWLRRKKRCKVSQATICRYLQQRR